MKLIIALFVQLLVHLVMRSYKKLFILRQTIQHTMNMLNILNTKRAVGRLKNSWNLTSGSASILKDFYKPVTRERLVSFHSTYLLKHYVTLLMI